MPQFHNFKKKWPPPFCTFSSIWMLSPKIGSIFSSVAHLQKLMKSLSQHRQVRRSQSQGLAEFNSRQVDGWLDGCVGSRGWWLDGWVLVSSQVFVKLGHKWCLLGIFFLKVVPGVVRPQLVELNPQANLPIHPSIWRVCAVRSPIRPEWTFTGDDLFRQRLRVENPTEIFVPQISGVTWWNKEST